MRRVKPAKPHKITKDILERDPVTARLGKSFKHIQYRPILPVTQDIGQVRSNQLRNIHSDISNATSTPPLGSSTCRILQVGHPTVAHQPRGRYCGPSAGKHQGAHGFKKCPCDQLIIPAGSTSNAALLVNASKAYHLNSSPPISSPPPISAEPMPVAMSQAALSSVIVSSLATSESSGGILTWPRGLCPIATTASSFDSESRPFKAPPQSIQLSKCPSWKKLACSYPATSEERSMRSVLTGNIHDTLSGGKQLRRDQKEASPYPSKVELPRHEDLCAGRILQLPEWNDNKGNMGEEKTEKSPQLCAMLDDHSQQTDFDSFSTASDPPCLSSADDRCGGLEPFADDQPRYARRRIAKVRRHVVVRGTRPYWFGGGSQKTASSTRLAARSRALAAEK